MPFAEQGSSSAQFLVGAIYANGRGGVVRDHVAAASWIRLAAEAFNWYRRAAEQGYAAAQFSLGVAHYNGDGVPQDPVLGYAWASVASRVTNTASDREPGQSCPQEHV